MSVVKDSNNESSSKVDHVTSLRLTMINSKKHSDVKFLVGQESPQTIYGHIAFLVSSSEVFATMFSGDFADLKQILIPDMKPAAFIEMMKFIYAGPSAMTLDTSNMIELLYGAQKYMLSQLKSICEDFIVAQTDESNVLEVYNASQFFENTVVQDACIKLLLDNPMLYFEDEKFKDLCLAGLQNLLKQQTFNCTANDLSRAVLNWQRHQSNEQDMTDADAFKKLEQKAGIKKEHLNKKNFLNMEMNGFGQLLSTNFSSVSTICKFNSLDTPILCRHCQHPNYQRRGELYYCKSCSYAVNETTKYVYGIGLYTGGHDTDATEEITITLSNRDEATNSWTNLKSMTKTIKQQSDVSMSNIYFDKVEIKNYLLCEIDFKTEKTRYTQKLCTVAHNHFRSNCQLSSQTDKHTPIACVFYSNGKDCTSRKSLYF